MTTPWEGTPFQAEYERLVARGDDLARQYHDVVKEVDATNGLLAKTRKEVEESKAEVRAARQVVEMVWDEVVKSGNANGKDYGWPAARTAVEQYRHLALVRDHPSFREVLVAFKTGKASFGELIDAFRHEVEAK